MHLGEFSLEVLSVRVDMYEHASSPPIPRSLCVAGDQEVEVGYGKQQRILYSGSLGIQRGTGKSVMRVASSY